MNDLPITVAIVPETHPIRSRLPMQAKYITIHETANRNRSAGDEMHAAYVLTPDAIDRTVLWHATVDEDSIHQHLPWDEAGWHAGDGYNGPGNRRSIGVELCVNGNFEATQRLAARLVARLVKTVPSLLPFPECMAQHNRWSGKDCPAVLRFIPGGWDRFVGLCRAELDPKPAPTPSPAPAAPLKAPVLLDGVEIGEALIIDGRSYLPVRALGEALGLFVHWDGERVLLSRPERS